MHRGCPETSRCGPREAGLSGGFLVSRWGAMYTWHLTFSARGRQAFYPSEDGAAAGVRALVRSAGSRLAGFSVVDDHVHAVPVAAPKELPGLRRSTLRSLRSSTVVPVDPAYVRHVDTRRYLTWLVEYLLLQPLKHELPGHAALWPGSFFLDLVGARHVPGLQIQLGRVLPRYRLRSAFEVLGLGDDPLAPANNDQVSWFSPPAVVLAAARATCAPTSLAGRTLPEVRARLAASHLLVEAGVPRSRIGSALSRSRQTVHRLLARPADPRDLSALRLRLALETRVVEAIGRQTA